MIEAMVACARFAQLMAAAVVFGAPLFFLYALGSAARSGAAALSWGRGLAATSGGLLILGALTSLFGQTATMAGDPKMAFDAETLDMVLTGTGFGYAIVARLALASGLLILCAWLPAGRRLWLACVGVGALILASFAWTGHGAAEEGMVGVVHALCDIVHLLAAGVWLGALAALAMLLRCSRGGGARLAPVTLHKALEGFSGVGSLSVAALIASGLVNSWFLVGPDHLNGLATTLYGRLLLLKLALFGAMLLLAAANRFRLTPALGLALQDESVATLAIGQLRHSLFLETALGLAVLALVAVLGMLAPVAAIA